MLPGYTHETKTVSSLILTNSGSIIREYQNVVILVKEILIVVLKSFSLLAVSTEYCYTCDLVY